MLLELTNFKIIVLHRIKLLSNLTGKCQVWFYVFFAEGFKEAAEKFKDEASIKSNVELSGMDSRIKIRDAIQAGRIAEATSMVHQMYPELLDDDRYLFFHLQVRAFWYLYILNKISKSGFYF